MISNSDMQLFPKLMGLNYLKLNNSKHQGPLTSLFLHLWHVLNFLDYLALCLITYWIFAFLEWEQLIKKVSNPLSLFQINLKQLLLIINQGAIDLADWILIRSRSRHWIFLTHLRSWVKFWEWFVRLNLILNPDMWDLHFHLNQTPVDPHE